MLIRNSLLGLSLRCLGQAGIAGDIGSRQVVAAGTESAHIGPAEVGIGEGTAAEVGTVLVLGTEEGIALVLEAEVGTAQVLVTEEGIVLVEAEGTVLELVEGRRGLQTLH